ncbi:hypothetical protein F5146DRAFT_1069195 [Armillaria mellea]|nr:hypothetical protein F5146DRAFT_1069195 [Armillaria mellea]
MHAKEIDDDGNYETALLARFHTQRKSMGRNIHDIFAALADMQKRVSTNPVDKVAGLTFRLGSTSIPLYYESASLEDAWTALVDAMGPGMRGYLLFVYPEVGLGCKKRRPSWNQVMTQSLPADVDCHGYVKHVAETDEDLFEGPCIEKGLVRGLDAGSAEGVDRCGELVVDAADGSTHTFKIRANHKYPIPEDTYTLLGSAPVDFRGVPVPQYWVIGQRLLGEKFEKVSVFYMDHEQAERLKHLSLAPDSRSSDDKEFSETHRVRNGQTDRTCRIRGKESFMACKYPG